MNSGSEDARPVRLRALQHAITESGVDLLVLAVAGVLLRELLQDEPLGEHRTRLEALQSIRAQVE